MYILLCCDTLMNVTCDIHVSVGQYMLEQHLLLCVTLTHALSKEHYCTSTNSMPMLYIINIVHAVVADKHSYLCSCIYNEHY